MPNRRPFQYQKRDPACVLARIRGYQFDAEFKKAISEANKRRPERLCELLRSSEPLSDDHREMLAHLIEWHLKVRTRGRPHGSPFTSPRQEAEQQIVYMAQKELARKRERAGGKRLPRGTINQVIRETADRLGEIYDGDVPEIRDISLDNIRNAVKRGTKRRNTVKRGTKRRG
jgi:hypothetical protein